MKQLFLLTLLFSINFVLFSQNQISKDTVKTIHVFVALCDNANQGIVPVPETLGNGQSPKSNLYWGALYGVKTHFLRKDQWELVEKIQNPGMNILERIILKHKNTSTYLMADAYDGAFIQECITDFVETMANNKTCNYVSDSLNLSFGIGADLIAYVGHDGLMEFDLDKDADEYTTPSSTKDIIVLACYSRYYFKSYAKQLGAKPLVWTTGLMAPEAYILHDAIESWIKDETPDQISTAAAAAYNKYQKCGIKGASRLLVNGY